MAKSVQRKADVVADPSEVLQAPPGGEATNQDESPRIAGTILKLAEHVPFWRLESGKFELNRFKGTICGVVPENISPFDLERIRLALAHGRLVRTSELGKAEPATKPRKITDYTFAAYRIIDENDPDVIASLVSKVFSAHVLEECASIELAERRRQKVVSILTNRLREIQAR